MHSWACRHRHLPHAALYGAFICIQQPLARDPNAQPNAKSESPLLHLLVSFTGSRSKKHASKASGTKTRAGLQYTMPFHVLDRSENAAGWLLCVILTPICIFALVLRFVATKHGGRSLGWDDFWALLGLVFYIPYVVYLLMRKFFFLQKMRLRFSLFS
jgi:uncharacterized membrane protein (GlpM family)